jgi:hypothetical protein
MMQDTLDDKLRQMMEKRLRNLLEESEENRKKYLEKKFAVRYHKVRFFERIKVERRLSKIKKDLKHASSEEEKESLGKKLAAAQEDLEYVLHFPKGEKYVSLLRDADTADAQAHLESERQRLRDMVKKKLRDEAIVNEPDEGVGKEGLVDQEEVDQEDGEDAVHGHDDLMGDDFFAQSSGSDAVSVGDDDEEEPPVDSESDDSESEENLEDTMEPSKRAPVADRQHTMEKSRKEYSRQRQTLPKRPAKGKGNGSKVGGGKPAKSAPKGVQKTKPKAVEKQPLRTRAEGGRKRRKKK